MPSEDTLAGAGEPPQPGFLMVFIKGAWFTIVLVIFVLGSAIVFKGIEGNHEELIRWKHIDKQDVFNATLRTWIEDHPSGQSLRSHMGLSRSQSEEIYEAKLQEQFEKNYTASLKYLNGICQASRYEVLNWTEKSFGDALMYAVSIMSTIGWGVYYPPTWQLRLITIGYAVIGLPLFGACIGFCINFVTWIEKTLETKKIVLKFLGGAGIVRFIMLFLAFFAAVIYSLVAQVLVNSEFEGHELKEYLLNMDKSTWDFYDSFYFTIETVTTIGFGDEYIYSPGGPMMIVKPLICIVLSVFLISVFSQILSSLQGDVEKKATRHTQNASMKASVDRIRTKVNVVARLSALNNLKQNEDEGQEAVTVENVNFS